MLSQLDTRIDKHSICDDIFFTKRLNRVKKSLCKAIYHKFTRKEETSISRSFQHSIANVFTHQYQLGYHFINEVMYYLTSDGLELPASIMAVVKNPPTKLQQLKNPVNFSRSLVMPSNITLPLALPH